MKKTSYRKNWLSPLFIEKRYHITFMMYFLVSLLCCTFSPCMYPSNSSTPSAFKTFQELTAEFAISALLQYSAEAQPLEKKTFLNPQDVSLHSEITTIIFQAQLKTLNEARIFCDKQIQTYRKIINPTTSIQEIQIILNDIHYQLNAFQIKPEQHDYFILQIQNALYKQRQFNAATKLKKSIFFVEELNLSKNSELENSHDE